ncbi:MAG TPA: hypothetical protein VNF68_08875 [Candidatus Baltobacteraceae bacterium]|nr:hypothetical protein [Candidatus Baltobacteraceae bacterium]
MPLVRETIAKFIESEGHKVDVSPVDDDGGVSELLFRTRGQVFSITTYEKDPATFTISTAYEIPEWARERGHNAETLADAGDDFPDVAFVMAHEGGLFIVTADETPGSPEAFTRSLWEIVARVREAGAYAIEKIVDRTESKVAAEKFISSFMRGDQ